MSNTVSLDDGMAQEAAEGSRTSPTTPESEANDDDTNHDPGAQGETWSDDKIQAMIERMDVLSRANGAELDSNLQAGYNELRTLGLLARAVISESEFERTGTIGCIDKAVELRSQALSLTPEGHADTAERLSGLGVSLYLRFKQLGEPADVDKGIECLTQAVLLTLDDHASKPNRLNILGISYRRRFERLGEIADVDKAIESHAQAVLLTPDGNADKTSLLNNLGNSYACRFERFGEVADVDKAIEFQIQAVLLTPDGHVDKPGRLNNLGISYQSRFERLGRLQDIDKAIECQTQAVLLAPERNADKPGRLNNLGNSHQCRFERLGEPADLDRAIEYLTQAALLTPDDHADKPIWLNNLGSSYARRFERIGEVAAVDKAIECQTQAVLLTPDGHAGKPGRLNNLGSSYQRRFERLGEVGDVDKAIKCKTRAVLLTPDDHADKPNWLSNLGNSYQCRFEHLGELLDMDKAIEFKVQAVQLTPEGHADKPGRLNNLGISHQSRFERLGEPADAETAIKFQTQAVLLTPEGHADKPNWLNNLGISYRGRFERLGELADVGKAIEYQTEAVLLTPDGHADRPGRLNNLGSSYMRRFEVLGRPLDLESARSSFQCSAQHVVTNPSTQMRCARLWAKCCSSLHISPLPAYERCMELIPRVIWLGTTITQRYSLLTTIGDLAAEAAAWAIATKAYDLAVEWLEQGRSVVWSQTLQLRTPFDDLTTCHPSLADRLKTIAAQLDNAGTRATGTVASGNAPSTLEEHAQRHRHLADEWDKALAEARNLPGFESFMLPRKAEELKSSAIDGPIVLINTHSTRCDALVILPHRDDVVHLPLVNLSLDKAREFRTQLHSSVEWRGNTARWVRLKQVHQQDDLFKNMLVNVWSTIVQPILAGLGCSCDMPAKELLHVTWCATGALTFLPLHASGPYDSPSPNTSDLVISSYTPTLTALLASSVSGSTPHAGLLVVGQEATPSLPSLPFTVEELRVIKEHAKVVESLQLDGQKATIDTVLRGMGEHSWVHLACHASQNSSNPAHSAFHLFDGSLTLETISKRQFQNKGLAFLSACQTATGDDNLPDEAVHLAAGMLMAGYPSVIATMWPIRDADGPEVAGRVYAELLVDGKMDHRGAARALHKAVADLREKAKDGSNERWGWVPFIHIGV